MKCKTTFLLSLFLVLVFCTGPNSCFAQLTTDSSRRINNPLGFAPVRLHLGVGVLYLSTLTGIAFYLDRKNKEIDDKRLSFYFESGTNWSYKFPFTTIPETSLGFNYKVLKWLSYGADVGVYHPRDEFNRASGLSMLRIFNRFYLRDREKFRLWFESGVGLVYFTQIFPASNSNTDRFGTFWNGVVKYGLAAEFNITPSISGFVGVRHVHFSNADIKTRERNPASDSHGIFVGFNYNPRRDLNLQHKRKLKQKEK